MFPLLARDGSVEAGAGFRWLMPSVLVAIFRPRQRAARLDEIPRMTAQGLAQLNPLPAAWTAP